MGALLHITSVDQWASSRDAGAHVDPSLDREGFIHCSSAAQIVGTANRFFAGRRDLLLLRIDADKLTAPLIYEDTYGHGAFPHLYGALNLDAVIDVVPFPPSNDGSFELPVAFTDEP